PDVIERPGRLSLDQQIVLRAEKLLVAGARFRGATVVPIVIARAEYCRTLRVVIELLRSCAAAEEQQRCSEDQQTSEISVHRSLAPECPARRPCVHRCACRASPS